MDNILHFSVYWGMHIIHTECKHAQLVEQHCLSALKLWFYFDCHHHEKSYLYTSLSMPAQLQYSLSKAWEPGARVSCIVYVGKRETLSSPQVTSST